MKAVFSLLLFALPLLGLRGDELEFPDFPIPEIALPERPPAQAENREIFTGWPHLPDVIRDFAPPEMDGVTEWALPAGQLMVVANPPDLPEAYRLLSDAAAAAEVQIEPPLILLLHGDGNVSVGLRVLDEEIPPMPAGVDVSPLPALRLYLRPVNGVKARRNLPEFARAAGEIRTHATRNGERLHTRDLYLFPGNENTLLFGMRLEKSGSADRLEP